MKKIILVTSAVCCLLFANQLQAQTTDEGEQIENAILWKITGSGGIAPSYVFATISNLCEEQKIITDGIQEAIYDSQELIFDLDKSDPEIKKALDAAKQSNSRKTLKGYFASELEFKEFNKKLMLKLGEDYANALELKPWAIADLIATKNNVCEKPFNYDDYFLTIAKDNSIPVSSLETVKEHTSLLDKLSENNEKQILLEALNTEAKPMLKLFAKQDIRSLAALKGAKPGYKENLNDYFYYRNKKLAAGLKEKISAKPVFIVIDAASAGGENGLIFALLQEGFGIEPVIK
jgi:uncharacterized protein YbaP (TraB family)